jgi:hypothetical protein
VTTSAARQAECARRTRPPHCQPRPRSPCAWVRCARAGRGSRCLRA